LRVATEAAPATAQTALGLRFVGDPLPLLGPDDGSPDNPVAVSVTDETEVADRWSRAADRELLYVIDLPDGSRFLEVERDAVVGYRIWARGYGTHLVALDGRSLVAAPRDEPGRFAFRLLVSQVYPLLAALRGREVMHAGAAIIDDRLVGVVAPSGTGKSSTISHLVAGGAEFFADDVLALEPGESGVRAHPGPRLLNVPRDQLEHLPEPGRSRLGTLIGESEKLHFEPVGAVDAAGLRALFFLERTPGAQASGIEPLPGPAPVLANANLPYLDTPGRLRVQLDVLAALAAVPLLRVRVGAEEGAASVAARIREWAS
jgi:hypothetical protein